MDERESSTASSVDFYETADKPNTPPREPQNESSHAKRKADELASTQEKKRKLEFSSLAATDVPQPCAGLPPAVWQHIFLSCHLLDLGRLLRVNRLFHSYLTDVRNVSLASPDSGSLRLLKSEFIWASARNALSVKPPKPLPGFTELQMWQLAWSKRCQSCRRESSFAPGEKIWQKGPGATGVRTIWPFGIKACGSCLMEKSQTDASLLFSTASALRPALPFAFITNEHNYIPAYTLQAATTPATVEIAKYYFREHVEEITKELNDALSLGPGAIEEWSKGLEARGAERMKVAENWERWEVKYQWWSDHHEPKRATSAAPSPAPTSLKEPSRSPSHQAPSPVIYAPIPATVAPQYTHARPTTVPHQYTPHPIPTGSAQPSGGRNLHDANEAKANRKTDIERRCQQMHPPIPPNVLRHMDSFKAAIQISQPMTDYAWSVLQPRLVAQLPAAQQAEADHVSRFTSLPRATDRRPLDLNSKEAKEVMDREWDESQRPIRDRLSAIADDFINQDWEHGRAVTFENSPKFAVDLLVYVRRTFYAETAKERGASGQEQQEATSEEGADPNRPKLVLENMKWVYDNKLKPLTEQFRKELFLCYGTGCESNTRFYGFEGVIQHFGAKHTNAFSVGNIVVAWREAEWPEDTPFHPDPISVKNAYLPSASTAGHAGYGAYFGGYSRAGTSTPQVQSHLPQASPGPHHYGGHYNGPFGPPQVPPAGMAGYDYGQSYGGVSMDPYPFPSMAPPGHSAYRTSPAMSSIAIAPPPAGPSQVSGTNDTLHVPEEADYRTNLFDKQVSTVIEMAQDIWKQTSGIKDMPNSLRIYVLLQRVISKFHVEFNHEPNLKHFIDAFSNHEVPRALKNAPGLSCKACQEEISHYPQTEERRTYTVLNLFSHFKLQHSGPPNSGYGIGQQPNVLDWKEDMIELPSDRFISGLIHAPGMDDDKLHMIATVFPKLFPTPLPKIGVVDSNGVASPAHSETRDPKDTSRLAGTPAVSTEKSGPSSLASYADSPRPPKPSEDEYDPQRPALPAQTNQSARFANRRLSYRASPPQADRRPRYYAEPRYYLPRESLEDDFARPREYLEYAPSPRRIREPGSHYEGYHERRPVFREHEAFYRSMDEEMLYAPPREEVHIQEYGPYTRPVRYSEEDGGRPQYRYVREPRSQDPSPTQEKSAADRFLDEFVPRQPIVDDQAGQDAEDSKPTAAEVDLEDGSRYTPPPPNVPSTDEALDPPTRALGTTHHTAPSTVSNGSRYEEHRPGGRQIPTPDSGRGRRPGPHRRRDRYHDHVPSRYYRYMSVARDEPYSRAGSVSRAQSKRYERYEEQRRRIDQQETPQPKAVRDYDIAYSRDQSVDRAPPDDAPYQIRQAPREYVSVQDRLHPYSPPRYRYAGYPEDSRPQPVYVDQYGQPLHEYEIIRVPRDPRPPRGGPPARYMEHEPEHIQYVPVPYDRPLPQRYDGRSNYVYYEERERERPAPMRRPAYEAEAAYEPPPPEIKVENVAPVPDAP